MSTERGIHVFYEPEPAGGPSDWPSTMTYTYYLGVMQGVGETVRTGCAMKAQGDEQACNADVWARFSSGKPAVYSEDLQLVFTRTVLNGNASWLGQVVILSHEDKKVLFQITTGDTADAAVALAVGEYLRFSTSCVGRKITAVGREYGGMTYEGEYYVLTLDSATQLSNDAAGINWPIGFWAERKWWREQWETITEAGLVGRLKIVWADYDGTAKTVSNEDEPQEYEVMLGPVQIVEPYGALPGLGYKLQVKETKLITEIGGSMSYDKPDAPADVVAGANAYTDAILLTWGAVTGASRYQVYVSPTSTVPAMVEEQAIGIAITEVANAAGSLKLTCAADHGLTQGDYVAINFAALYLSGVYEVLSLDGTKKFVISGTYTNTTTGYVGGFTHGLYTDPDITSGLLAELSAFDWTDGVDTFGCLGVLHGAQAGTGSRLNVKTLPASGNKYAGTGKVVSGESHYWYWVRARVGGSSTDEWTDLSEAAHGVTKGVTV